MKKILTILVLIIAIAACSKKAGAQKGSMQRMFGGPKSVKAKKGSIVVKLEESGSINPSRTIDVKSLVSGTIKKFFVEEGDYVKQGQLLAEIEPDFKQADDIAYKKDNLKKAKIRLDRATKDYNDKLTLSDDGLVSEDELSQLHDSLVEAQINYKSAQEQYSRVKNIEINAKTNISKLFSTANGTVIDLKVEEGEMVSSSNSSYSDGTVVMQLADLEQLEVHCSINEVDISKVKKGQDVKIAIDAYPYDVFKGTVKKIGIKAIAENNIKVFPIEIAFKQADERLRPGMTAKVTIIGKQKHGIVIVPIRTIFADSQGNDVVYKVVADSVSAQPSVIKTGINDLMMVEIIDGVKEGENISYTEPNKKMAIPKRKRM